MTRITNPVTTLDFDEIDKLFDMLKGKFPLDIAEATVGTDKKFTVSCFIHDAYLYWPVATSIHFVLYEGVDPEILTYFKVLQKLGIELPLNEFQLKI